MRDLLIVSSRQRPPHIPAKLQTDASGPVASRVLELLEDSPRFDLDHADGFTIMIQGSDRELELCLLEPAGGVLGCASTPPDPDPDDPDTKPETDTDPDPTEPDDDDYASMTVEAFHARAFAMPVGLSNIDLGSLDGTATISDEANRERMQGLLDRVKSESD